MCLKTITGSRGQPCGDIELITAVDERPNGDTLGERQSRVTADVDQAVQPINAVIQREINQIVMITSCNDAPVEDLDLHLEAIHQAFAAVPGLVEARNTSVTY